MKEFKKNKQNEFVCEECLRVFKSKQSLNLHIRHSHNAEYKEYFDKWLKDEFDGICKICGNPTEFKGFKYYYDNCCSKKCKDIYRGKRIEEENLKNFGVRNSYQREDVKETIKNICLEKYGVECFLQTKTIKNLKVDKNKQKEKETKLARYGDENYNNIKKYKQTCLKKYGVENPQQNKDIFEKTQKSGFHSHKYKNIINYRGSYELDFLDEYFKKFSDLENGPTIKYQFDNKNKVYFPDFYIPSLNLVIEIKNSYNAKKDKDKIEAKRKATISSGFKYIMIIDKKYDNFILMLH